MANSREKAMGREPEKPRLMTKAQAAAYCSMTLSGFARWVADGIVPKPIPSTDRWDRVALDRELDKLSGIVASEDENDLQKWKRERDAKKNQELENIRDGLPRHHTRGKAG